MGVAFRKKIPRLDVNVKERCGATPLSLAVIKKNEEICAYLLDNFAVFNSHFFSIIPSPHAMAKNLNLEAVKRMDQKFQQSSFVDFSIWKTIKEGEMTTEQEQEENVNSIDDRAYKFNRKNKSCKTYLSVTKVQIRFFVG